ncbi:hypothetical protein G6O69_36120 [Pseudenhygromyxa sp. WMMC2535]|uniref:hypothetical protein n=1 Tax=Pseudenhygromyxa sp. WMMC2535 TaxID=2712867 RepID=UPI001553AB63|nr:hypothetical protein [Pseudenhygromyxa sp. WMMC2535]NVB43308.1 hypothetical protein [Pseudenhygromyxa sp. WMMC2535]
MYVTTNTLVHAATPTSWTDPEGHVWCVLVVKGKNLCRHLDIATSNHDSPGNTPPMAAVGSTSVSGAGGGNEDQPRCECCGQPLHEGQKNEDRSPAPVVSEDEWYCLDELPEIEQAIDDLPDVHASNKKGLKRLRHREDKLIARWEKLEQRKAAVSRARELGCKSLPEPPCNVYRVTPPGSTEKIEHEWGEYRKDYQIKYGYLPESKTNHRVPQAAGGCPGNEFSEGNLIHDTELSDECMKVDDELTKIHSKVSTIWNSRIGT